MHPPRGDCGGVSETNLGTCLQRPEARPRFSPDSHRETALATQTIVLQDHQLVALVAAILMTRATGGIPLSDDQAVKAAKRVADLAYAAAKPT